MKTLKRCHFWSAVIIIIGFAITACAEPQGPLTGTVSIIGTAHVGETLVANTNSLGHKGAVTFKWKRGTGGAAVKIGGNSATYVVQADDLGSTITVTVTCSDNSGSITSRPTAAVGLRPLTGTVNISGSAQLGRTLTANTSNLWGSGVISYQWMRDGTGGIGDNRRTYVVQDADVGSTITVTVTCSDNSASITSRPTAVIIVPPLTGTVRITGSAYVGGILTANTANLGGSGDISYQWMLGGTVNIGDNSNTYLVQTADVGYTVTVTVTRAGYSGSKTSNPTTTVTLEWQPSGEIKKVEFTEDTATVSIDNLSGNDVYLVKVNKSSSSATANATGSVQSVSPSSIDGGQSSSVPFYNLPYRHQHHPRAAAFNANPPPIDRQETSRPRANFVASVVGDTRTYWVEEYFDYGGWVQRSATLSATGNYGNIWVMSNGINTTEAQALSNAFDLIYPAETNILGFEYGGGPNGNGGKDGDPKVQILVYDIVNRNGSTSNVLGYFWSKDFYDYDQSGTRTNRAEIFYLNARYVRTNPELLYLTLAHEFQHMIHFNRKFVENGRSTSTWYNETLSMMTEDVMAEILGIPTTHPDHPIKDHVPYFIESYDKVGFSEWPSSPYPYSKGYTFGAYLMRNYGGTELLKRLLDNNTADTASITAALSGIEPAMTFEKAVTRFGEAMIFSGNVIPEGVLTFDKTVTNTITGYNGTHTYTLPAFDIWNMERYSSSARGPVVYPLTPMSMKGHSVLLQQDNTWKNRSGTFSITLNRPSNANVELYLMVR